MKRIIKYIKSLFVIKIHSDYLEYMEDQNPAFKIAVVTTFTVSEIHDFLYCSGLNFKEAELVLKQFNKSGISNLNDVTTLCKMGLIDFEYYKTK